MAGDSPVIDAGKCIAGRLDRGELSARARRLCRQETVFKNDWRTERDERPPGGGRRAAALRTARANATRLRTDSYPPGVIRHASALTD